MDIDLNSLDYCAGLSTFKIEYVMNKWFQKNGFIQCNPKLFAILYTYTNEINLSTIANEKNLKSIFTFLESERDEYVKRFSNEHIFFFSLRSLSDNDLQIFGVTDKEKRAELLQKINTASRDYPSFEEVSKMSLAKFYNRYIFSKMQTYMGSLYSTMYNTQCKLEKTLLEESLLDDTHFASSLILKAIDELVKTIDEALIETKELEESITNCNNLVNEKDTISKSSLSNKYQLYGFGITTIIAICLCGYVVYKPK